MILNERSRKLDYNAYVRGREEADDSDAICPFPDNSLKARSWMIGRDEQLHVDNAYSELGLTEIAQIRSAGKSAYRNGRGMSSCRLSDPESRKTWRHAWMEARDHDFGMEPLDRDAIMECASMHRRCMNAEYRNVAEFSEDIVHSMNSLMKGNGSKLEMVMEGKRIDDAVPVIVRSVDGSGHEPEVNIDALICIEEKFDCNSLNLAPFMKLDEEGNFLGSDFSGAMEFIRDEIDLMILKSAE